MKQILKYKNFIIEVTLKETEAGLVPLSFSVFYKNECVNGTISQEMYHRIEEALIEHYNQNPHLH